MGAGALFVAVFLACAVEAVEATTIVLAVGTARDWRSALTGVGAGIVVLAGIVAVLGPAVSVLPLAALRLVVGGLLLVFGLQWLRKAILRASGFKALHDEEAIFARQLAAARAAGDGGRAGVRDWYSFTLSFKGVVLEGLEVVSSPSPSAPTSTTSRSPRQRQGSPWCWWPGPAWRSGRRSLGYPRTPSSSSSGSC